MVVRAAFGAPRLHRLGARDGRGLGRWSCSAASVKLARNSDSTRNEGLRQRFGERFDRLDKTTVQAVVSARVQGSGTNVRGDAFEPTVWQGQPPVRSKFTPAREAKS